MDSQVEMLERYARGQLLGDELDAFEDYLMEHPELMAEIKAAETLRTGFRGLATAPRIETPTRRSSYDRWLAAAATVVLAGGIGFVILTEPGVGPSAGVVAEILLENTRGASIPPFRRSKADGLTLVSVDVGPKAIGRHTVHLRAADGTTVLQVSDAVVIDSRVHFVSANITPGHYTVEVSPVESSPGNQTTRFEFDVE